MNKAVEPNIDVSVKPEVTPFFDEPTNTLSYVVKDPASRSCAIVDCVMDLDYPSGSVSFDGAERIIDFIREQQLEVEWILETHVHADHLSAAPYIQKRLGGKIAIGSHIS
ncbi:MAG: MBL fold metallo-hydrolase, partial [Haliea sp.]|nr:MBL fold metallo-hydrolase [Haliea sp.]